MWIIAVVTCVWKFMIGNSCEVVIKSTGQEWWISRSMIASCGFIHLHIFQLKQEEEAEARGSGWKDWPGGCKSAVSWTPVPPHHRKYGMHITVNHRRGMNTEHLSWKWQPELTWIFVSAEGGMDSCLHGWTNRWEEGKGQTDMIKASTILLPFF